MTIFELNFFGINIAPSYYGLMYAIGFLGGYYIILKRGFLKTEILDNLFIYIFAGVVLGGRFGYIIFYNLDYFLANPSHIIRFWEGGMSFHGGILGVIIAMIIFAKRNKISFYKLADQIAAVVPIGLGLGRIGNYLNKELLGYSGYNGIFSINNRFPSPLLESFLEGLVLFIILNLVYKKRKFDGQIASLFLIFYGIFRIFVEAFFRMPDSFIGYIWGYFTLGEIYSLPMLIFGLYFYFKLKNKNKLK